MPILPDLEVRAELVPASRTFSGLLFPVSLQAVGDHISTRSAARKRNGERAPS